MKQLCIEHCIPLSYIINSSVNKGNFPEELKLANVILIYITDNEQHIRNYRPIAALPFFSKIFEKVIYNKLLEFVNANYILYKKIVGFCQGIQQVMLL